MVFKKEKKKSFSSGDRLRKINEFRKNKTLEEMGG